jgi:hypothetical protein
MRIVRKVTMHTMAEIKSEKPSEINIPLYADMPVSLNLNIHSNARATPVRDIYPSPDVFSALEKTPTRSTVKAVTIIMINGASTFIFSAGTTNSSISIIFLRYYLLLR